MIDFEWDLVKARSNLKKHDVSFGEAATVLNDRMSITFRDPDHSIEEERYISVGASVIGRLLIVAHTDRGNKTRIISARQLTRKERQAYENSTQKRKA